MITVLRIGHRRKRDERISTHCGLVARAFGARKIIYSGEKDDKMLESISSVSERWGHGFSASYDENYRKTIRNFSGTVVHLTMYGIPFEKKIRSLKKKRNILVIIGSEKVPREVYEMSHFNLSVTNQPHSEVASLAVFLSSMKLNPKFKKPRLQIIPQARGKKVLEKKPHSQV